MSFPGLHLILPLALVAESLAETAVDFDELFPPETTAEARPAPVPSPLIAHLTFDDSGELNADASGKKNSPAIGGNPGTGEGVFGGAVECKGGGHFVWQGAGSPLVRLLDGSFTVCVWVKTTQKMAADGAETWDGAGIVWADFPGYHPPNGDSIPLSLTGSKAASFISGSRTIHSASAINTGEWVHLAYARGARATGGSSKLYVNGKLEATAGGDARPLSDAKRLAIGANLIDRRHFIGLMDDLRIYNVDLSEGEIFTISMLALARSKLAPTLQAKVMELESRYEADRASKVESAYHQGIQDLRVKYLAALKRASENAVTARDLQAAVVFQREIQDMENGVAVRAEDGPGAPPVLLALRKTYREALPGVAALRTKQLDALMKRQDAALGMLQEALVKSGKSNDATLLKAYRSLSASRKAPSLPDVGETPKPAPRNPAGSAFGSP